MCDRMGLLHQGRLQHEGTLAELQQMTGRQTLFEMFLGLLGRGGKTCAGEEALTITLTGKCVERAQFLTIRSPRRAADKTSPPIVSLTR